MTASGAARIKSLIPVSTLDVLRPLRLAPTSSVYRFESSLLPAMYGQASRFAMAPARRICQPHPYVVDLGRVARGGGVVGVSAKER